MATVLTAEGARGDDAEGIGSAEVDVGAGGVEFEAEGELIEGEILVGGDGGACWDLVAGEVAIIGDETAG